VRPLPARRGDIHALADLGQCATPGAGASGAEIAVEQAMTAADKAKVRGMFAAVAPAAAGDMRKRALARIRDIQRAAEVLGDARAEEVAQECFDAVEALPITNEGGER
jgi:hypothetical protein